MQRGARRAARIGATSTIGAGSRAERVRA